MNDVADANITARRNANSLAPSRAAALTPTGIISTAVATGVMTLASMPATAYRTNMTPTSGRYSPVATRNSETTAAPPVDSSAIPSGMTPARRKITFHETAS